MIKKLLLLGIMILGHQIIFAQFNLDAEFRTRAEHRDGYLKMPTENNSPLGIVLQRSRLIASYKEKNIETKLSIQDARIWGEDKYKTDNVGLGLYEAWLKYTITKGLAIQVGRMELSYDDARLFCNGDWRTYGQSMDLARLIINSKEMALTLHIGYSVNNNATDELSPFAIPYNLNSKQYKNLSYIWVNKKLIKNKLSLSVIGVYDGYQHTTLTNGVYQYSTDTTNYRLTTGLFIKYKSKQFGAQGAYYMQNGKDKFGKTISSDFYNIMIDFKPVSKLLVGIGYDHYSGTDLNSSNENNTFENLYGPGHKFLGWIDFFGNVGKYKAGINDIIGKASYNFNTRNKLVIMYHMFQLDQKYLKDKSGTIMEVDKALGSEIDLMYVIKAKKNLSFTFGYSSMLYTESMEILKGVNPGSGEFAHFGWIQMKYKPNLFSYTKPETK
jgi:hypothetical protein